jgi:tetratricopeptide (TPR) repeat protein
MNTKENRTTDSLMSAIEQAVDLGRFVHYRESWEFVSDLEDVKRRLDELVSQGESQRAVPLYEVFLAGCYEKADEIDDSDGALGDFYGHLFCSWILARQKAGLPAQETVDLILRCMKNDNYGFCFGIEKDVTLALNREGFRFFKKHFEDGFDKAFAASGTKEQKVIYHYPRIVYSHADTLKDIYEAKKDSRSYLALCDKIGLAPKDCERIAGLQTAKRQYEAALAIVEKGLRLQPQRDWRNLGSHSLDHAKQELLAKMGRIDEALRMAWRSFQKSPTDFGYDEFMKYVPRNERREWHQKAMAAARTASLDDFIDLCAKTKEWEMLAERIHAVGHEEIEDVSHYTTEKAAKGLARKDIPAAAKIYRALGLRIVKSGKSKYYNFALAHFRKARDLYRKCGNDEWYSLVESVKREHSRKYSFIGDFETLAEGGSPDKAPSFRQITKKRWARQVSKRSHGDG